MMWKLLFLLSHVAVIIKQPKKKKKMKPISFQKKALNAKKYSLQSSPRFFKSLTKS